MILGLKSLDAAILIVYIVGLLFIGQRLAKKTKSGNDFFLGGRKLGKWFQFFLNFGNMADPSSAPAAASSVYKQGIGGIWLLLIPLFLTPYYWFMSVWFRRVRLTTIGDLFEDRFGCRFLATLYAIFAIGLAILTIGFGNIIALKTLQPIMIKSEADYTSSDRQMLADYHDYEILHKLRSEALLSPEQEKRYDCVKELYVLGRIHPYVSHLQPVPFYVFSSLLVTAFIVMGGLTATAMVNAVQSVLVMVVSFILIPFGLIKIGGFSGLHERVPAQMFYLFGDADFSQYTWYSIAALLLVNFVAIPAAPGNMNIGGSAKDELAARMGAVTGGYAKRFVTIGWGMAGLIGLALWGSTHADPDLTWGRLTLLLLPTGLIGLMIIGILGGKLASLGAQSIVLSALVVKNLYEPLFPGRPDRHYMLVARISVPVILGAGIAVALVMGNALSLYKFILAITVTWGAPILLIFQWRRLTRIAVVTQVVATILLIGILPYVVSSVPAWRQSPSLTTMTREETKMVRVSATGEDVSAGRAKLVGDKILKARHSDAVPIFFEDGVVRKDPSNPDSPKEGLGRFNIEIYLLYLMGIDVKAFTPPFIMTIRFLVDALLPVFILLGVSCLTRPDNPERTARFYVRLKTPVVPDPAADAEAVSKSYADPRGYDHTKLLPKSDWEFTKWDRLDALGFLICCAFVGVVLLFFKALMLIGS